MRIYGDNYFSSHVCLISFVLLCFWATTSYAIDANPTPVQAEINRLVDLSETQKEESLKQLIALQNQLPADAKLEDQRDALIGLIDLYIKNEQSVPARKQNADLSALGVRYHDNWSSAMALNFQAVFLQNDGKLDQAKETIEQALLLAKNVNVNKVTNRINGVAGSIYQDLGDFEAALQHQLVAMDSLEEGGRNAVLMRIVVLNDIGILYLSLKNPELALEYNAKATKLALSVDAKSKMDTLAINRGHAYGAQGKYADAMSAYKEARNYARRNSNVRSEVVAVNNLADVTYRMGHYTECLQYAKQTLLLAEILENSSDTADAHVNIGLCRMGLGEVQTGAAEVNLGIDSMRKANAKPDIEMVLGKLASAYEKAGMYREAYKAQSDQIALTTELFGKERNRTVSEMKAKYDAIQSEKQIEVLEQKTRLQSVEINNKSLQRVISILASLIAVSITLTILFLYRKVRETNHNLEQANLKLAQQSTRDPLTGLLNRRAFHEAMQFRAQITDRRTPADTSLSHALVLLDIDHFKRINDKFGHAAGDKVLIELSNRLTVVMREKDMLMRWGGEEFLIFLNHIPIVNLQQVIERILVSVGGKPVVYGKNILQVTVSAGYISLPQGAESEVDLNWEKSLNLADSALYMAKTRGRNQAIGIKKVDVPKEEFDELLQGDLENSIKQGKITIEQIAGPPQSDIVAEPGSQG
ncbi:tetratricopeptide repeat-containing diguanylate cyclase [Solimicrobium silvestre]|uniref:diguanylate cyclase n=1 Tax=Solimicrobium silvestre TaxID=2099400 RepID=A0A2S9H305_9BURK|nr:tetratricopeptide repeat-containing diguanylate cyclase [Solimicrobium silvestre]PRC94246.1 GGDEF: diguanylate cyclase (GGDEF) domain [Solimicrobium silvestre]